MGDDREHQAEGGEAAEKETATAGAPGRMTLSESMGGQMGGNADPATAWGGAASRPATRIDMTAPSGGGSMDPFDFGGYAAGLGNNEEEAIGGAAKKSTTTDVVPATWLPHGRFGWYIGWGTDGTNGWIVQKVTNTYTGSKKDGTALTAAGLNIVPVYYEAWAVDSKSKVSPSNGATNDMWTRPNLGVGSKGTWSMRGDVYWTDKDPAASGMKAGAVKNAGILVSGTSAPAGLSSVLQVRSATGTWDSTGATPTHTGSAT